MSNDEQQEESRREIYNREIQPLLKKACEISTNNKIPFLFASQVTDPKKFSIELIHCYPETLEATPLTHAIHILQQKSSLVELVLGFIANVIPYHDAANCKYEFQKQIALARILKSFSADFSKQMDEHVKE